MSTGSAPVAPKRLRGHQRVAAILDAAVSVFAHKGLEGATMSEIAAQSKTAIGSLYRFFPTKEAVALGLVQRYCERLIAALEQIRLRAGGLSPQALADELVGVMLELSAERAVTLLLLDTTSQSSAQRHAVREAVLGQVRRVVEAACPQMREPALTAAAVVVLQWLKSIPALTEHDEAAQQVVLQHGRWLLGAYLGQLAVSG